MKHLQEILPNVLVCEIGLEASTSYYYNELDRIIRTKNPLGNIFALKRNTEGKVTKEIHPSTYNPLTDDGEGIINIYDEEDRKIKLTMALIAVKK